MKRISLAVLFLSMSMFLFGGCGGFPVGGDADPPVDDVQPNDGTVDPPPADCPELHKVYRDGQWFTITAGTKAAELVGDVGLSNYGLVVFGGLEVSVGHQVLALDAEAVRILVGPAFCYLSNELNEQAALIATIAAQAQANSDKLVVIDQTLAEIIAANGVQDERIGDLETRLAILEDLLYADTDGDGVIDLYDNCRLVPGTEEFDGCPPPPPGDQDQDGVPDDKDKCPNTPPGTPVGPDGCELPEPPDEVLVLTAHGNTYDKVPEGTLAGLCVEGLRSRAIHKAWWVTRILPDGAPDLYTASIGQYKDEPFCKDFAIRGLVGEVREHQFFIQYADAPTVTECSNKAYTEIE